VTSIPLKPYIKDLDRRYSNEQMMVAVAFGNFVPVHSAHSNTYIAAIKPIHKSIVVLSKDNTVYRHSNMLLQYKHTPI